MSVIPPQPTQLQSLADALQRVRQQVASQLPPDVHARLSSAIDDLVSSKPGTGALRVGQNAPDFSLPDLGGHTVTLSEKLRAGPVVVTFYRGSWCPYCDLMLRAYSNMVPQLQRAGAQLIAISPQRADAAVPNAAEHRALNFPVVTDAGNRVAREYGLVYSVHGLMRSLLTDFALDIPSINGTDHWELPVPATFLVTTDALIRWAYVEADYRLRAEPDHILRALAEV